MNPNRIVIIALGSNLGDSGRLISQAVERLRGISRGVFQASSVWRTKPVDCPPDSPDFLNAVVIFQADDEMTPRNLLETLQEMERGFGRRPKEVMNEPRPLDLDIITFGREIVSEPDLVIPHARAHQRRFVLDPLHELSPDYQAPGWAGTVAELLQNLPENDPTIRMEQSRDL